MYTARSEYVEILKEVDNFDVVLLSIGENGHVASLFPDANILDNGSVLLEYNSPKPPKERISMSYDRLNSSRNVLKIAIGQSKQQAVNLWIEDKKLPISEVHGDNEKIYLSLDSIPEVYRPYIQFNPVQI
jgi:6-phosphogluconolactonase